jgi:hypothetical protein
MNVKTFEPTEAKTNYCPFRNSRLGGEESDAENMIMDGQDG